jgi:hypothetical protein
MEREKGQEVSQLLLLDAIALSLRKEYVAEDEEYIDEEADDAALLIELFSGQLTILRVVLQKMDRDVKSPSCAPIYTAIPKRFDTNLTCI